MVILVYSGPSNGIYMGQRFVNDDDITSAKTWLQALARISLRMASLHWFTAGASASTGVVIK
jgi:hypothetical protein